MTGRTNEPFPRLQYLFSPEGEFSVTCRQKAQAYGGAWAGWLLLQKRVHDAPHVPGCCFKPAGIRFYGAWKTCLGSFFLSPPTPTLELFPQQQPEPESLTCCRQTVKHPRGES